MRIVGGIAGVLILLGIWSTPARATAFAPAPLGTRIFLTNGGGAEIDAVDGFDVYTINAAYRSERWVGMCFVAAPGGVIDGRAVGGIWPLNVGNSVRTTYEFRDLRWNVEFRVVRRERLTVAAGTFDTWLIESEQKGVGDNHHSLTRCWYAPDVGFLVRREHTVKTGSGRSNSFQAARIERRDRSRSLPFEPPPAGMRYATDPDGTIEVDAVEGSHVKARVSRQEKSYIGGLLRWDGGIHVTERAQPILAGLWPLEVGRSVSGDVAAWGSDVFSIQATVERTELLTTPAGTFNTFVVRVRQRQVPRGYDIEYRYWYAPSLRFVVKQTSESFGQKPVPPRNWVLTGVQRPATDRAEAR